MSRMQKQKELFTILEVFMDMTMNTH